MYKNLGTQLRKTLVLLTVHANIRNKYGNFVRMQV